MGWWKELLGLDVPPSRTRSEDYGDSMNPMPEQEEEHPATDYYTDVVYPMFLAKKKEIDDSREEILKKMMDNYRKQFDGYNFSCIRYGDFLNLFIERTANADIPGAKVKFSTALNLSEVTGIRTFEGRKPDMDGDTSLYLNRLDSEDIPIYINGKIDHSYRAPRNNERDYIETTISFDRHPGLFVRMHGEVDRIYDRGSYNTFLGMIPNTPRREIDDGIHFLGLDAVIHVPCGKGEEVRQIILAEIARGYEAKDLSKIA